MKLSDLLHTVKEFAYGLFVLDPLLTIVRMRYHLDLMFMSILYSDTLGVPIIPPIYRLNLLKYYYPMLDKWKIELLKEKDITDKMRG
ncbi:hypothetical protein DRN84_01430 [Candidatus Geothermarchaeota archaeon]|nr:MAG: hypothetical protein DRN87_04650 [Candidatus Geothermarchaeota archaeon]RLG62624.1 MAG: hypothetical protein DRN84_01430 [Candidatus Geothermarchaeota archaeon]HEW94129.1 hypothetical protein [Thermoprotei archaeon]